jgi:hypothetical protein
VIRPSDWQSFDVWTKGNTAPPFPEHIWPDVNETSQFGQIGDYIGGVWGTLFTALTLVVVFFTWRVARGGETRNSLVSVLTEMLKTHDEIVSKAPDLAAQALREFATIYKVTRRIEPRYDEWPARARVDIAYTYTFYGLNMESRHALDHYGAKRIKDVGDEISRLRQRARSRFAGLFKGHQETLSHYMRNLFAMFLFIDESRTSKRDKLRFAKVVRTKLSNYDQALLAANIISHLGSEWESRGLVDKYKPVANVPKHFFGYDDRLNLKSFFPMVQFEWEKKAVPRPVYRRFALGAVKVIWYRQWFANRSGE